MSGYRMLSRGIGILMVLVLAQAGPAWAREKVELQLSEAMAAEYAPVVRVVDTVSSLGPLAPQSQTITLEDLARFHGHPCDGLVVAAAGIEYGLKILFPEGVVDRTDLSIAVNRSACYGDVAAYLTGARHRYGSMIVDPKLGDEWIITRHSTGQSIRVRLKNSVKPKELPVLEAQLREAKCPKAEIEKVQKIQKDYALRVLSKPPATFFDIEFLESFPYPVGEARPDAAKASCDG